ncbi:MerR family transcriptional regulator [Rothia aerolata]|uniref:MerR family transcriptional regulator n=1 Tax=Rothia aerolata TaxID=1812262 RepID=A0A917IXH6_9MICC|nr:MerR family transcriptional regulator [Rothia aerolata]GGH65606.1 MerR family transcriptional regulator [Rothia aerolata]
MHEKLTVGQVASLVGVSVRTLHHYEESGLLNPARTRSGYRVYSSADIDRLQQILVYRSLDFSLHEIQEILETGNAKDYLSQQKRLLIEKIYRLQSVLAAVETMMEVNTMNPTAAEKARAMHAKYRDEAESRYGASPDFQESERRSANFSEADWASMMERTEHFEAACAQAMNDGVSPGSAEAGELAERHRELMNLNFDCSYEKQVLIAKTYVTDERFTQHYNKRAEGLAQWIHDAVLENARAQGVDVDAAEWK